MKMTRNENHLYMNPNKPFSNIFSDSDFCSVLKISNKQLFFLCHANSKKLYKNFLIPKRDGSHRIICAPIGYLKNIQRRISLLLREYYEKPKNVEGMEPGTSIVTNASKHLKRRYLINIDLKTFYDQIHIGRLIGFFQKRLKLNKKYSTLLAQLVTVDGILPTGSPCSPIISDMLFFSVDLKIKKYINNDITYTRYADDLSFSFDEKDYLKLFFEDEECTSLKDSFIRIFEESNFPINCEKTRMKGPGEHHQVTGIKVNKECNLNRYYKHWIRLKLSSSEKYGLDSVAKHYYESRKIAVPENYLGKFAYILAGKISYFGMVRKNTDPIYISYASRFNDLVHKQYFSLLPLSLEQMKDECVLFSSSGNGADSGSAFIYKKHIISCFHCHELFDQYGGLVKFEHPDGRTIMAKPILIDKDLDLVIYKPNSINYFELKGKELNDKELKDANAIVLGYPDFSRAKNFDATCVRGNVFSDRLEKDLLIYSINTHIQPGFSGGPVLDEKDLSLIGMVVFGSSDIKTKYNNGFLPLSKINEVLECAE